MNSVESKQQTLTICPEKADDLNVPKKSKKVLDEDTFVQRLEAIIERDFFPDAKLLRDKCEYLEALEANDVRKIQELQRKLTDRVPTDVKATPSTFETPIRSSELDDEKDDAGTSNANEASTSVERPKESLNSFLAKHTSEDNVSFQELMDDTENQRRQKLEWLYKPEERNSDCDRALMPPPGGRPHKLDMWSYKAHNSLMYVPDGAALTTLERAQLVTNKNVIEHTNTRFSPAFTKKQQQLTVTNNEDQTESVQPVDGVRGFSFVATPSPAPDSMGDGNFMTWGEIEGTPALLEGSATPILTPQTAHFKIQEMTSREKLAHELADKSASQTRRKKKQDALQRVRSSLSSPSLRSPGSSILSQMSPAARRLIASRGIGSSGDEKLRAAYNSPLRLGGSAKTPIRGGQSAFDTTPSPAHMQSQSATPKLDGATKRNAPTTITDDLLKIPAKRKGAAEFF